MTKMTILLTGATGYLGSELLRFWIGKGYNLIILKRSNSSLKRIHDLESRFISYDVDKSDWEQSFSQNKIDAVVHVAASYGRRGESFVEIIESNVLFPIRLLDLAIETGVKYFINTSSSLPKEVNDYALSKAQFQEWIVQKKNQIHGVNLVLEYFYGPGDDDWKFISMVVKKLKENVPSIDFTNGLQKRDFIYISDVVAAYSLILNKIGDLENGISIPVGSGNALSLKSIVELCQELIGNTSTKLNFGALPDRLGEIPTSQADMTILENLGWKLHFDMNSGIKKIID